jgi:hypothetical protein
MTGFRGKYDGLFYIKTQTYPAAKKINCFSQPNKLEALLLPFTNFIFFSACLYTISAKAFSKANTDNFVNDPSLSQPRLGFCVKLKKEKALPSQD